MKATELINELNKVIAEHGDVEIASTEFYGAGYRLDIIVEMIPQKTVDGYSKWDKTKKYCLVNSNG